MRWMSALIQPKMSLSQRPGQSAGCWASDPRRMSKEVRFDRSA